MLPFGFLNFNGEDVKRGFEEGRYATSNYFRKLYNIGELGANAIDVIDLTKQPYAKYLPFNEIIITNLSNQTLEVRVGEFPKLIPPNAVIKVDKEKFRKIEVRNLDNIANDGLIEVAFRRKLDIEELIKVILGIQ